MTWLLVGMVIIAVLGVAALVAIEKVDAVIREWKTAGQRPFFDAAYSTSPLAAGMCAGPESARGTP